ncbi:hypothetical protein [Glutamicibacter sp.]|uniref:hypothetical protein n=1 Tax=Glutamicibacter sp. TaxID=1931995 RepID=UPI002B473852|nr:hypothetical protein [Glutamicibacter sp.]HJX78569.1 hypothetical protein [Glutamicibacter sp.]
MAIKTIHGIDLTAPGGIEALFAFHYNIFGDAVMMAANSEDEEDEDEDEDESDDSDSDVGSDDSDSDEDEDDKDPDGADALGDKGKNALRIMKDKLKASKKAEREAKAELQRSKSSVGKSEEDQEAERKREERDAAVLQKANERVLRSDIKAAAAGKLQNPALAIRLLDLSDFEPDEDGVYDEDEIAQAIDDLIETDPYLAAQSGKSTQFDSARGKRKTTKKYTKKDLESMSPADIAKAYDDGKVAL